MPSTKESLAQGFLIWMAASRNLKSFKPETFMTTVRWRLTNSLGATHTYGYITKSGRIALNLEKSHYNDAFVIAGGSAHKRATPIFMGQKRRNNRKLETFVDAKYVDKRTHTDKKPVRSLLWKNGYRARVVIRPTQAKHCLRPAPREKLKWSQLANLQREEG